MSMNLLPRCMLGVFRTQYLQLHDQHTASGINGNHALYSFCNHFKIRARSYSRYIHPGLTNQTVFKETNKPDENKQDYLSLIIAR